MFAGKVSHLSFIGYDTLLQIMFPLIKISFGPNFVQVPEILTKPGLQAGVPLNRYYPSLTLKHVLFLK